MFFKREKIELAKRHGIKRRGKHYKVYQIYRCSSYTEGGVYRKYNDTHDFGEIMLVSPDDERMVISTRQLLYNLKKRKHDRIKRKVDGVMTDTWSEWVIDWDYEDEEGLSHNDIYLFLS